MELYDKVNALGIGAQGLGGLTTVLDVKIATSPTHAATKPVAMIPNCAATRHAHFVLDGSGPADLRAAATRPDWPDSNWAPDRRAPRRVDLDTADEGRCRRAGSRARRCCWRAACLPAATPRTSASRSCSSAASRCPVDFSGRVIYYVGPVDPVRDEVVGPAGPTTSTRMDKFTEHDARPRPGLIAMIGKAERGPAAIEAIRKHRAAYLMAVGGAAYLVSKAIKQARVLAFADLGMEAIYEFEVTTCRSPSPSMRTAPRSTKAARPTGAARRSASAVPGPA